MADQGHDDRIGDAGVLEQADRRMTQAMEGQIQSCTLSTPANTALLVVPRLTQSRIDEQLREFIGECSDPSTL